MGPAGDLKQTGNRTCQRFETDRELNLPKICDKSGMGPAEIQVCDRIESGMKKT